MNVLVLFGSPRENGCTARLVSAFCSALPEEAVIRTVRAYSRTVQPCRGCGVCSEQWACAFDDMEDIIGMMLQSDVIVIASPVYHLSFPAPLKAILDRTQRCFMAHRQQRSPFGDRLRQAVVLLTAGSPSENGHVIKQQLRWLLPPINATQAGVVVCANTDAEGINRDSLDQASALAEAVVRTYDTLN